ncbi:MAG: prepilin-type N-terminal cleavage/methylation domain-containing protein [Sideroxydans sp.]|nr:prepilin-type N-terminal cleavage/methylation domain-containing protein [Sideroxydans sp.]
MKTVRKNLGFTLIEMAMVLMIIALVLGGLLPVISGQIEQQRSAETRKQLAEIREALLGFAVSNNRLPCPADGTLNTGVEATTGAGTALVCSSITALTASGGVLPWTTLGVSETDAWGRRFTYRVTSTFADGADGTSDAAAAACPTSTGVSFKLCSQANLNVLIAAAGANVAANLPVVVVSHGKNGLGAYTQQGAQLPGALGDELENANTTNSFVSHETTSSFDDLLVWIPPNLLTSRMIAAGKLP